MHNCRIVEWTVFGFPGVCRSLPEPGSRYLSGNLEYNSSPQKIKYYISEMYLSSPDAMQPGSRPWVTLGWVSLGHDPTSSCLRGCHCQSAVVGVSSIPASRQVEPSHFRQHVHRPGTRLPGTSPSPSSTLTLSVRTDRTPRHRFCNLRPRHHRERRWGLVPHHLQRRTHPQRLPHRRLDSNQRMLPNRDRV